MLRYRPCKVILQICIPWIRGASIDRKLCYTSLRSKTFSLEPFSRFPIPSNDSLPADVQTTFQETKKKAGFVPNVFKALSYRPDELKAFIQYYDVVMDEKGNLTKADKEMIIVATSAVNSCLYCIIAHGALHRIYSKDPYLADQIAANWKTADITDRQRAILEFADQLCHCKPLTDDNFEKLYEFGLTKDDAWDIGSVVALFALSNRMAFLTNMKPNEEFHLIGRVKREQNES
ncbi:uncharacterized protein LOC143042520 isoform X1 [Mytilus galloprovincialis]|uniref:uncharacterized protein LOC143042520 isoform X1 n=1 Tax=Mytilus galloprovincialis TaxID=29158 RepID=UPI003F7C7823